MRLWIENSENSELLKKYGLAMAYINQVDYILGNFIDNQERKNKQFKKTCQGQALGQKLYNNKKLLKQKFSNKNLYKKLELLNKKRKIIAHHGFTKVYSEMGTEKEQISDAIIKDDGKKFFIKDANNLKDLLEKTIKLGKKILPLIYEELKKI